MLAQEKYTRSLRASDGLLGAFKGKQVFSTADHIQEVKGERRDKKSNHPPQWHEYQGNC